MLLISRALVPELVKVTVLAVLGVERTWVPKNKETGESVTVVDDCCVTWVWLVTAGGVIVRDMLPPPHPDTDNSKARGTAKPARTHVLFMGLPLL